MTDQNQILSDFDFSRVTSREPGQLKAKLASIADPMTRRLVREECNRILRRAGKQPVR